MPALFRIVQDEYPPIPDGLSSALKDFLMQCFQKDPLLRVSGEQLLKHRWIAATKAPESQQTKEQAAPARNRKAAITRRPTVKASTPAQTPVEK